MWSAELLRVAYQDVWVVIVGEGPELQRLQRLRDQYGAVDAVKFAGHRSDAQQLMSAFDILWNGSRYEGQSNTILEAMSWGVPVVASDIPGNRDLVIPNETGILYPLGDAGELTRQSNVLLRDPVTMQRLGDNAKQLIANHFSLERMIDAYSRLYTQLMQQTN